MEAQAGWKCEECRRNGLEDSRGCAWKGARGSDRVVWVSRGVASRHCPRSVLTGESLALVEAYWAWKKIGGARFDEMDARQVHAFLVLERELRKLSEEV